MAKVRVEEKIIRSFHIEVETRAEFEALTKGLWFVENDVELRRTCSPAYGITGLDTQQAAFELRRTMTRTQRKGHFRFERAR